jgi:hypothetical protein
MRTIVLGVSGIGKTTLSETLLSRGLPAVDMDALVGLGLWYNPENDSIVDYDPDFPDKFRLYWDTPRLVEFLIHHPNCICFGVAWNSFDLAYLFDEVILINPDPNLNYEELVPRLLGSRRNPYNPWEDISKWLELADSYKQIVLSTYRTKVFVQRYDERLPGLIIRYLESNREQVAVKGVDFLITALISLSLSGRTFGAVRKVNNLQAVKRGTNVDCSWKKELATKGDTDYQLAWIVSEIREYLATDHTDQEHRALEIIDFLLLPGLIFGFEVMNLFKPRELMSLEECHEIRTLLPKLRADGERLKIGYDKWDAKNVAKGRPSRPWSMIEPILKDSIKYFVEAFTI